MSNFKVIKTITCAVKTSSDIISTRKMGRDLAIEARFSKNDQTIITTAISEVARNILEHAREGSVRIDIVLDSGKKGIIITAKDKGPGISNIDKALTDGYSTGRGLGMGLPGARRLMDSFSISSAIGKGTTVVMMKWIGENEYRKEL